MAARTCADCGEQLNADGSRVFTMDCGLKVCGDCADSHDCADGEHA